MRWSFSRLNSWRGCKIAWWENYINKNEEKQSNFFSEYGLFCEDLIQKADEGDVSKEDLVQFFDDNFHDAVPSDTVWMERGSVPPLNMKEFYYLAARNFFMNFSGFSTPTISYQEEVNLKLPNGDEFIGYIDRLSGTSDKYYITDFKSKGEFKTKKELKEYSRQLFLYSEYTIKKYGKPPEMMFFHLFRSYGKMKNGVRKDVVEVPWNKKQYKEALEWRDNTIEEIKRVALFDKLNWQPTNPKPDFFFCQHLCSYSNQCNTHKTVNKDKISDYEALKFLATT